MQHVIVGTAGHIDHGKTTLIKALTGRNTDRWEEEQKRGITIDLGFTWCDLPDGTRAGIIDVPGHEKFINNMVAGVCGMDLVLLVIAADEGIMPQTREHVDILGLLGAKKSLIVLNKCDTVDEEWTELVEEEIREELSGTFLAGAPLVRVSAATGEGIENLKNTLVDVLNSDDQTEKKEAMTPRLPIDRVFSLSGFGTIVTGTLLSGEIDKKTPLCVYPEGLEAKVRSIQVHGEDAEKCFAGQRVAINISNLKKSDLKRGCVLAPPGSMQGTMMLDTRLYVTPTSNRILTNRSRLHLFTGTSEVLCRAVLLDKEEIGPGESGYVQLRLEDTVAVRRGDRFIVRFYSPMETIGGGEILDAAPDKKKRFNKAAIEELTMKEKGDTSDILLLHIKKRGEKLLSEKDLLEITGRPKEEVLKDIATLKADGRVLAFELKKDTCFWEALSEKAKREEILSALLAYEKAHPYRHGMKKAEVMSAFLPDMKPAVYDQYIEFLVANGDIERRAEFLQTKGYEISKDDTYRKASGILRDTFTKARYDFVRFGEIDFSGIQEDEAEDILMGMVGEGEVIRINEDMYTLSSLMEDAKNRIIERLRENGGHITISEVRDMLGTSRKSAKPVLEYMDRIKVTKKTGGEAEREAYQL